MSTRNENIGALKIDIIRELTKEDIERMNLILPREQRMPASCTDPLDFILQMERRMLITDNDFSTLRALASNIQHNRIVRKIDEYFGAAASVATTQRTSLTGNQRAEFRAITEGVGFDRMLGQFETMMKAGYFKYNFLTRKVHNENQLIKLVSSSCSVEELCRVIKYISPNSLDEFIRLGNNQGAVRTWVASMDTATAAPTPAAAPELPLVAAAAVARLDTLDFSKITFSPVAIDRLLSQVSARNGVYRFKAQFPNDGFEHVTDPKQVVEDVVERYDAETIIQAVRASGWINFAGHLRELMRNEAYAATVAATAAAPAKVAPAPPSSYGGAAAAAVATATTPETAIADSALQYWWTHEGRTPSEFFEEHPNIVTDMSKSLDTCVGAVRMRWERIYKALNRKLSASARRRLENEQSSVACIDLFRDDTMTWPTFLGVIADTNKEMFPIIISHINTARHDDKLPLIDGKSLLETFEKGVRPTTDDVKSSVNPHNDIPASVRTWASISKPVGNTSFTPIDIARFMKHLRKVAPNLDDDVITSYDDLHQWLRMQDGATAVAVAIAAIRAGEDIALRDAGLPRLVGDAEKLDIPIRGKHIEAVIAGTENPNDIIHKWVKYGEPVTDDQSMGIRARILKDQALAEQFAFQVGKVTGRHISPKVILSSLETLWAELNTDLTDRAVLLALLRMRNATIAYEIGLPTLSVVLGGSITIGTADADDNAGDNADNNNGKAEEALPASAFAPVSAPSYSNIEDWLRKAADVSAAVATAVTASLLAEEVEKISDLLHMELDEFLELVEKCDCKPVTRRKMVAAFKELKGI